MSHIPDAGPARLATDEPCELGEGPLWDPIRQTVHWLDINAGTFFTGALQADGTITTQDRVSLDGTVGAAALTESGEVLLARTDRLSRLVPGADAADGPALLGAHSGRRFNDGKPDPSGRFVAGTLSFDGAGSAEELLRVEDDGSTTVLDSDLALANGLAWSRDGRLLYTIDTGRSTVFSRGYDPATGQVGTREEFLRVEGNPDGMCLDTEEHLWIAMFGMGQVQRYSPSGALVALIEVPAPQTTSVAFAGPDLATLVITTARENMSADDVERDPLSGYVFTAVPGVKGLPQPFWNGRLPAAGRPADDA